MKHDRIFAKYIFPLMTAGICLLASLAVTACGSSPEAPAPSAGTQTPSAPAAAAGPAAAKDGDDTSFTLLMYMIGSDLETMDSAASSDIAEILEAQPSHGLTVLLQTGGAQRWHTEGFREDMLQRRIISDGGMTLAEELPQARTSLPETLRDFLSWGISTAPADRYGVILWDHGGGATLGYGLDEYYPDESLSIAELCSAFEGLDVHFDFIGFDACLMGTMETALAFSSYADYLLASEEYEPSTGWFYTDWIRLLDADPSIPMTDLGTVIVDDFVSEKNAGPYDFCTLALIDLHKIPALYEGVRNWFQEYYRTFDTQFSDLSKMRRSVKSFGDGNYEEVDLLDLLQNSPEVPQELADMAAETVIHAAHNRTVDVSGGLSLYYPYVHPAKYDPTAGSMTHAGFQNEYFAYYDNFVTTIELAQKARAAREERHDALGLVEAAGFFEASESTPVSDGASDAEILLPAGPEGESGDEPPELHPEDVRFRQYIRIHEISEEEAELISDVRLLQLNPVDDGFIFVGKESGGPEENGTGADLSGGHYLAIEDTLVSFELVYDSELSKETIPDSTANETENTEEQLEDEEETTAAQPISEEQENAEEQPENAETTQDEAQDELPGDLSSFMSISKDPDAAPPDGFGMKISLFSVKNDLDPDVLGEEGSGEDESEADAEKEHADDWFRYGYVDAVLNGDRYVDLMVCWDKEHPHGIVAGYREVPEKVAGIHGDSLHMPHRGLQELKPGDKLQFYFSHFDKDGKYDGRVFLDEPIVCGEERLRAGRCRAPFQHMKPGTLVMFAGDYVILGEGEAIIAYRITDVYNNIYYVRAQDAWVPENILRLDPDHPEELWMELARRYAAESPEDNDPNRPGGDRLTEPAAGTNTDSAGTTAAVTNENTGALNAVPDAAQNTSAADVASAVADAVPAAQGSLPEGSYTVIDGQTDQSAQDSANPPEEYSDDEIDAFLNSELEDEEDETDPDDDEPSDRTQPETYAPEIKTPVPETSAADLAGAGSGNGDYETTAAPVDEDPMVDPSAGDPGEDYYYVMGDDPEGV
ncbi:MAG: hypothetical protein IJR62_09415 [Lachnospiraceae bacterium]|nr:hypothetical protein [Lachnospiraceae bacterium]